MTYIITVQTKINHKMVEKCLNRFGVASLISNIFNLYKLDLDPKYTVEDVLNEPYVMKVERESSGALFATLAQLGTPQPITDSNRKAINSLQSIGLVEITMDPKTSKMVAQVCPEYKGLITTKSKRKAMIDYFLEYCDYIGSKLLGD